MTDTRTLAQHSYAAGDRTARFAEVHDRIRANVEQVIRGKSEVVRRALTCLFAGGHLLIEDVPGVGKTSLAKALAGSIDGTWHRIQFTPDLLPSDITGVAMWNQDRHRFEFHPGAVFANLVVGDEINRASPKTQSALLEVMEERQVTVDAVRHPVPAPFMVLATQNPIDLEGTYRLPEAQLDRFLMRIAVGYPDDGAEEEILTSRAIGGAPRQIGPVTSLEDVGAMIGLTAEVHVAAEVTGYIVAIAKHTRRRADLRLGVSPRGSLALLRAAQAHAAADGRDYVVPDDVKTLAPAVLAHRLLLTAEAEVQGGRVEDVLADVLSKVPVPKGAGVP
jgi:MoxR-like ATPase